MHKKLLIVITHSSDAPERAAAALAIANAAVSNNRDVVIFALNEGALLVKGGFAETITDQKAFPPIKDLLQSLVEAGQQFLVCSTCAKQFGLAEQDLLPNTQMSGAAVLLDHMDSRETITL